MVNRCYNTKLSCYKDYGGRGITICDEWFDNSKQYSRKGCQSKGWIAFRDWALSHGYRDDLTIDRIDVNKGYSPEKAQKFTERTIDAGTDIEDAREALQSNKEFFQGAYNKLLQEAQQRADAERAERTKQADKLKDSIMKDKQLFGDMELSSDFRKKVFENISKPIYKDPETGQYLTAIQKFETEHPGEFLKFAGLFYTLTDGFKDFKSFAKAEVKKEMKKGLRELEQTLQNTRRNSDGSLNMVGSRKSDPESFLDGNFRLAL
jgi:hypothetical protein